MQVNELTIRGLYVITPRVFEDARGFFLERYSKKAFEDKGMRADFVQDNHSHSKKGVVRGLHFQTPPHAQDKLVWVTRGEVLDVAVDLRKDSPTCGKWESVTLSEENKRLFFIPKGFAHGFSVLSDTADLCYKVSDYYAPQCDAGIVWNDPKLAIDWKVVVPIVSEKDLGLPLFKDINSPF